MSEKKVVIIGGAGKAFCSGIDLLGVVNFSNDNDFHGNSTVSRIMDLIHTYRKPYVAICDGITMGGGSFFSMTSKYRIVTENTIFAMPEAQIGFYNNAGSSYFLSRLKNNLGFYIPLVCARIRGYDLKKIGLASHFVESNRIEELISSLGNVSGENEVKEIIESFSSTPKSTETELDAKLPIIDKCFNGNSVEEIYENLHQDGSDFSKKVIRTMNQMSPTSLKICHEVVKRGKYLSLRDCLIMEHRLTYSIFTNPESTKEFLEGVRALLIDKDMKPKWNPKNVKDVKDENIQKLFQSLPENLELKFDRFLPKL